MFAYKWNCPRCDYEAVGHDETKVANRAIRHAQRQDHGDLLFRNMGAIYQIDLEPTEA